MKKPLYLLISSPWPEAWFQSKRKRSSAAGVGIVVSSQGGEPEYLVAVYFSYIGSHVRKKGLVRQNSE